MKFASALLMQCVRLLGGVLICFAESKRCQISFGRDAQLPNQDPPVACATHGCRQVVPKHQGAYYAVLRLACLDCCDSTRTACTDVARSIEAAVRMQGCIANTAQLSMKTSPPKPIHK